MTSTWVGWTGAQKTHAVRGRANPNDVRLGGFPVVCGRWAPDPMDHSGDVYVTSHGPYCARCQNAIRQDEGDAITGS